MASNDDDVVMNAPAPESPLLGERLQGEPEYHRRRPLSKGKIIFILTVIFAAILITAVIILAVRTDNDESSQEDSPESSAEMGSKEPPCPKEAIAQAQGAGTDDQVGPDKNMTSGEGPKVLPVVKEDHKKKHTSDATTPKPKGGHAKGRMEDATAEEDPFNSKFFGEDEPPHKFDAGVFDVASVRTKENNETQLNTAISRAIHAAHVFDSFQNPFVDMQDISPYENRTGVEITRTNSNGDIEMKPDVISTLNFSNPDFDFRFRDVSSSSSPPTLLNYTELFRNMESTGDVRMPEIDKLAKAEDSRARTVSSLSTGDAVERLGSGRNGQITCGAKDFPCKDNNGCYRVEEKCDKIINCQDNSDEENCRCVDYLDAFKMCDGFNDCPDGSDESNCTKCLQGGLLCQPNQNCLYQDSRCNNAYDCSDGCDEDHCAALAPIAVGLDPFFVDSPYSFGLLYWKVDGAFQILSIELPDSLPVDLKVSYFQQIGDDVCRTVLPDMARESARVTIKRYTSAMGNVPAVAHLTLSDINQAPNFKYGGGKFGFRVGPPDAFTTLAFVDCGEPVCGTRTDGKLLPNSFADNAATTATSTSTSTSTPATTTSSTTTPVTASTTAVPEAAVDTTTSVAPTTASLDPAPSNSTRRKREDGAKFQDKIVGGSDSGPKSWPATVALYRDGRFICGGTIVASEWFLCAAHCMEGFKEKNYLFQVVSGMLRKRSPSVHRVTRKVTEIYIHPSFDAQTFQNDIAVVKVDRRFLFNSFTSLACLPDLNAPEMEVTPDSVCYAVGWGNTMEDANPAETLQQVRMPILPKCSLSYTDDKLQICGGKEQGGLDSCQGDSGGPLYCQDPTNPDRWYLGGIISNGIGCARPNTPGVYTRVSSYLSYINTLQSVHNQESRALAEDTPSQYCSSIMCDGLCLPERKMCDYNVDCSDGSDEINCKPNEDGKRVYVAPSKTSSKVIKYVTPAPYQSLVGYVAYPLSAQKQVYCPENSFKCTSIQQCIPLKKRCDSIADCTDASDEQGCVCSDFMKKVKPELMCDGYPDCPNWEDEASCSYNCKDDEFYCHLSKQCIPKKKICDRTADSTYREDERYCISLFTGDTIYQKLDGNPVRSNKGLIAYNVQGSWTPVCTQSWNKDLNDKMCQYMQWKGSESYNLIAASQYPNIKGKILKTRTVEGKQGYSHSLRRRSTRAKRADSSCFFVESTCSDTPTCGVMPLYYGLGENTPTKGPGTFPWQVTLYRNGEIMCGGTLVHKYWVLTHADCAKKAIVSKDTVIARAGGYREQFSMSANDQFRRVVAFTAIPNTNIVLGFLKEPFDLNEYVSIVCIPSITWVPLLKQCYITGRYEDKLNYAYQTQVQGVCDYKNERDYSFCTKQTNPSNECLNNWSGALVCPDATGTFYAVGIYYSEYGNCATGGGQAAPSKFETLVSKATRDGILALIKMADISTQPTYPSPNYCPSLQCPNGKCLKESQKCDHRPDCQDFSDESPTICGDKIPMCKPYNATHCQCRQNEMLCSNGMCLDKSKFCDGRNDCGDKSDEPAGCQTNCAVSIKVLHPEKLCDGAIDCNGKGDAGQDEAAATCCKSSALDLKEDQYPYRCASGEFAASAYKHSLNLTDQCINSKGVCDQNTAGSSEHCQNGADESDCINIWPSIPTESYSEQVRDPFGRYLTQQRGYIYFVAFGKKFLYCAGPASWPSPWLQEYGKIICDHEGFKGLSSIDFVPPKSRTRVARNDIWLSPTEQSNFDSCKLVLLTCQDQKDHNA